MARFKSESGRNNSGNAWYFSGNYDYNNRWNGLGSIFWGENGNGDYYFGEFLSNNRTGYGFYRFASSAVYMGDMLNGKQEGKGVYSFANGDYYFGNWKNNLRHGLGLYIYQNGDWFYGNYVEGQRHGAAVYYYAKTQTFDFKYYRNGQIVSEKTIQQPTGIYNIISNYRIPLNAKAPIPFNYDTGRNNDGIGWDINCQKTGSSWTGLGAMQWDDGSYYFGEWLNGTRTGIGTYKYPSGAIYMGGFDRAQFHGRSMYVYPDTSAYFGEYRNDMKEGPGFYLDNGGSLAFFDCHLGEIRDGRALYISSNMTIKFCRYQNGKLVSIDYEFPFDL